MKKLLAIFLVAVLAFSGCALATGEENTLKSDIGNALGLEILHRLYQYDQQAVFSPASLTFALAMAAHGARGETREQMLGALGVGELSLDSLSVMLDALTVRGVKVANAQFISTQIEPLEEYAQAMKSALDAEIFLFENMTDVLYEINEWARKKTDGLIEAILDGKPDLTLRMVLVNALAIDAKWRMTFNENDTRTEIFHSPAGEITVDYMNATRSMRYLQTEMFQAAYLPYEQEALGMYVVLPGEGRMFETLEALAQNGMRLLDGAENKMVDFAFPKSRLESSMELSDILKLLGVTAAFEDTADFTGITAEGGLKLGEVTQTVMMEVNEQGTVAAAATAAQMMATSAQQMEIVEMTVNRPYIMLLYDSETGAILFAAAVSNPSAD